MRFTSALLAGGLAIAVGAQETPTATASIDPVQSSIMACVDDCDPTDVGCLSKCNPVPNPSKDQIKDTNDCVSNCDQGDGSPADTRAYGECIAGCIKENYYDSSQGTPDPTGGSGGGGSGGDDDDSSPTGGSGPTTTGTGAAPTQSTTESGSEDEASPTESGDGASETGEGGEDAATGLVASSAAFFGVIAAVLAL